MQCWRFQIPLPVRIDDVGTSNVTEQATALDEQDVCHEEYITLNLENILLPLVICSETDLQFESSLQSWLKSSSTTGMYVFF